MDPAVKDYFAKISRMGGKARAKKLSKEERAESARKAAEARWAKQSAKLDSTVDGINSSMQELRKTVRANASKRKKAAR